MQLVFDIFAATAPNGARLQRLTNQHYLAGTSPRVEHRGVGAGQIVVHSDDAWATAAIFAQKNWVKVIDLDLAPTLSITGTASTDVITVGASHGLNIGDMVEFTALTGGSGLSTSAVYYVTVVGASAIEVSATRGGSTADFTTDITAGTLRALVSVKDEHHAGLLGFSLEEGDFDVLSSKEQAGRILTFKGPGGIYYLERGMLLDDRYEPTQPARGSYDVDGFWTWRDEPYGAILTRFVDEGQNEPGTPLADLTIHFTRTVDSDGNAWPNIDNEYQVPIGTDGLQLARDFTEKGLILTCGPNLDLRAFQSYGTDRSSATFTTGKVRFEGGINVSSDLKRAIVPRVDAARALVAGKDNTFEQVTYTDASLSAPAVNRWVLVDGGDTDDATTLQTIGKENLKARRRQTDSNRFPHLPGDDEANGLYTPGQHYWLGDLVTLHTGSGEHDYNEQAIEVAGITWQLREAGDWDPIVDLGAQYLDFGQRSFNAQVATAIKQAQTTGLQLCDPTVACEDLPDALLTAGTADNGDAEDTGGGQWSGGGYQTTHHFDGARSYGTLSASAIDIAFAFDPAQVFSAGVRQVLDVYVKQEGGNTGQTHSFGVAGGDEEVGTGHFVESVTGNDGTTYNRWRICWTPTADRTGVRFRWQATQSPVGYYVFDGLALYTADNDALAGTRKRAARCDHSHLAQDIVYKNGASGLSATNVQAAIDELAASLIDSGGGAILVEPNSGSAYEFDPTGYAALLITLDADCAITFPTDLENGVEVHWAVHVIGDGTHVPTFPDVTWPDNTAPTFDATASSHRLEFVTYDGGTTVFGDYGGSSASSLIVREVGGSDIDPVSELEFDADDFTVTDQTGGVARVALTAGLIPNYRWVPVSIDPDGDEAWQILFDDDGSVVMMEVYD